MRYHHNIGYHNKYWPLVNWEAYSDEKGRKTAVLIDLKKADG